MLKVIGPCGELELPCAILAHRHIHMGKEVLEETGLKLGDAVSVKTEGIRSVVFNNVIIVAGGKGSVMHVDTEEGNAAGVKNGDMVEII